MSNKFCIPVVLFLALSRFIFQISLKSTELIRRLRSVLYRTNAFTGDINQKYSLSVWGFMNPVHRKFLHYSFKEGYTPNFGHICFPYGPVKTF